MTKDSRFKSKFTSANNAMAKARAFFRLFELKHHHHHHHRDKQTPSSVAINTSSSDEDSQIISHSISKTDQLNPRDMIVYRVINTDDKLPSNYFQQKYKQYLKPSLLLPKQYYNELLNKRNYSSFNNRYDFYSSSSTTNNDIPSLHYRPVLSREIKSPSSSIVLSSSSSMLTWNQCVRRLNTEYRLTIDALEQAKECLKQVYSNPKYPANRRPVNVTFCLPSPPISDHSPSFSIEPNKILPSIKFSKPKLIKPVELDTFSLSPELSIIENDDKLDSVTNIIKKFNSLTSSSSSANPRVHFEPSITTYEIPDLLQEEPISNNENIVVAVTQEKQINSKPSNKFISQIPKRIPTNTANVSRIKPPSKMNSSNKQKLSSTTKTRIPTKKITVPLRPSAIKPK